MIRVDWVVGIGLCLALGACAVEDSAQPNVASGVDRLTSKGGDGDDCDVAGVGGPSVAPAVGPSVGPAVEPGPASAPGPSTEPGPGDGVASTAQDPDCDMTGIWAVRMMTVADALGLQQCGSQYFYMEIAQQGGEFEVVNHFNCGIEGRGSANATFNEATARALLTSNSQIGRRGTMKKVNGQCELTLEPYWQIIGADETSYVPDPRNTTEAFSTVKTRIPVPTLPDDAIDFDGDGVPGVAFRISVAINGTRHAVMRNVHWWETNQRYTIEPAAVWTSDLEVRAAYYTEEVALSTDPPGDVLLRAGANMVPDAQAARATLHFLGRTLAEASATGMVVGTVPAELAGARATCKKIVEAMPPIVPLGFPQICPCSDGNAC